ncbi:hypothetical protein [Rossellomorea yichunensis]|jgi:hypothetical protein|uniref:hypothetical protein n=1 Tax=Rossellomorea yichunensis TaxID=3077331 RepID=UPI0028DFE5EE|nr:hypothetical protein [Rossellomorea sp. YC4-1]MDT9027554.1 hypothetical protein [Rossellomorea sp. YC4-1]
MERMMFDLQALKEIRKKADEISYYCMSRDQPDPHRVSTALDQVCRALAMFAETEIHRMENHHIPYDPESYIKGRLGIAHRSVLQVPQEDSNTA